jgi:DNA-directed RNA polymerase subunit M/transcription elongation factor TFIIS
MTEVLPGFLFRSRRGICPTCGAALALKDSERFVKCGFCGQTSSLERRLRKLDADLNLPKLQEGAESKSDTRALARALGDAQAERVNCPGCGDEFEGHLAHEILTCPSCGTQSKVERRMVRPEAEPRVPPQRRNRADFRLQARGKSPWCSTGLPPRNCRPRCAVHCLSGLLPLTNLRLTNFGRGQAC